VRIQRGLGHAVSSMEANESGQTGGSGGIEVLPGEGWQGRPGGVEVSAILLVRRSRRDEASARLGPGGGLSFHRGGLNRRREGPAGAVGPAADGGRKFSSREMLRVLTGA